jgi:GNAT acetyltransferase-like protein
MRPMNATSASGDVSVREYRPGDEQAIIEMIDAVFKVRWTADRWRRWFEQAPEGPAIIHLLERDGRLVGHFSHIGIPVFVDGRRVRVGRGGPTMVLPECQGQGGMRRLVEAFLASDHGFAFRMNFPNDRANVLLQRYGAGRHVGQIPRWVRSRRDDARAGAAARLLVRSGAMGMYAKAAAWPAPRGLTVAPLTELGPEVDALAQESAAFARCIRVRDATYLRWRWVGRIDQPLTILGARDREGSLRGLVVFGINEAGHGHIVDVVARDAPGLRMLLVAATDALFDVGCARVVFDYLDPRPWARRAVRRAGFVPWGEGMNIIVGTSGQTGPDVERLESWYLTAGDTERC